MKRFVYTPKLEVFVKLDDDERGHKTVNLTEDIVSGSVIRRLNAVSEASLTLQNKHGKYTGGLQGEEPVSGTGIIIKPMDRIIIKLSRVGAPFLVFSGYVDEAPYYQLYPGPVSIRCSCPLKLLQYTFFDPGLPYMNTFFQQFGWFYDPTSGLLQDNVGSGGVDGSFGNFDVSAGIGKVLEETLIHIGGWDPNAIDILSIPIDFLKNINKAMNQELKDQALIEEQMLKRLEKLYGIASAQTTPSTGDGTQVFGNVPTARVAKLALDAGFKGDATVTAVAIAMAESSLNSSAINYNSNNTYDLGIWQINTVHTSGGTGLPAPSTGVGTTTLANFQAVTLPAGVAAFARDMFVPAKNAAQAYSISSSGSSFTPWSTYNNKAYQKYLTDASTAVGEAKLGIGGTDFTATATTDVNRQGNQNANSIATKIIKVAIAESKKGIREANGSNTGAEIQKYFTYVGIAEGNPWCACFVSWVYGQGGKSNVKTASVATMYGYGSETSDPKPADIVVWGDDHTGIVIKRQGDRFTTVEGNSSNGVNQRSHTLGEVDGHGNSPKFIRVPGIGLPAADAATGATGTTPGDGQSGDPETIAMQAAWFTLQLQSDDSILSQSLTGTRAIANDIPLLNWISSMVQGSARVFTTKPDGTFFAFFPDRFGYFHDTPYFQVSDIELIDLTVQRNDQNLATHVFATGSIYGAQAGITWMDKLSSTVASIESPAFPYFINVNPDDPRVKNSKGFSHFQFLRKFGARPFSFELPDVRHPILLWMACWMKFVELWAKQYTANASMTFMPEILPGGLVEFGGRITMFVEEVTHNFDRESGFTTDAQLTSPATVDPSRFSGLPITGGRLTENDYIDGSQFFKDIANR